MKKYVYSVFLVAAVCGFLANEAIAASVGERKTYGKVGEAAPDVHFAKAIEDLPLMPGLEVIEDKDVAFIFGSSRIAQTTAKGRVDIDSVYYFYQDTLPQLGWKQIRPKLYERESELLRVEASSANAEGMTFVHFEVEPN